MSGRKLFVVTNPTSGSRGRHQSVMREFLSFVESKDLSIQLVETTPSQNAAAQVNSHFDNGFTDLVIIGGDGTFNEAINGLDFDVPVTFIPAGTGNDFVKNLSIGKKLPEQLSQLTSDSVCKIDVGHCNGRKFLNGVGIGFDGQIVEDMAKRKVPLLSGHAKYYYHVLSILASYKERPFDFSLNGHDRTEDLILMTVGNGTTFGGGFKLMPDAKLNDGQLEVCTIGAISGLRRFLNIHKLSNGTHGTIPEVNLFQATEITLKTSDVLFAHIDGERMGTPPFSIGISPQSLQVRGRLA